MFEFKSNNKLRLRSACGAFLEQGRHDVSGVRVAVTAHVDLLPFVVIAARACDGEIPQIVRSNKFSDEAAVTGKPTPRDDMFECRGARAIVVLIHRKSGAAVKTFRRPHTVIEKRAIPLLALQHLPDLSTHQRTHPGASHPWQRSRVIRFALSPRGPRFAVRARSVLPDRR